MIEYFKAFDNQFSSRFYSEIFPFIKIGLDGLIEAEFRYYLSIILRYLLKNYPEVGIDEFDYNKDLQELDEEEPISEIF